MIIDDLSNAEKYFCAHPLFAKAFEHIKLLDLETIEPGRYEISDQLRVTVSNKAGMTVAESVSKFECHNHHIDIQLCIKGSEQMQWKPRNKCLRQRGEYNIEKDVLFYNDEPDMYFKLSDQQFAIFFPGDVHNSMIGEGNIRKLVVKVKI